MHEGQDTCLFLGGPLDGQWRMVRKGQEVYAVAEIPRLPSLVAAECREEDLEPIRQHVYVKSKGPMYVRNDEGTEYPVYFMTEKGSDFMEELIKGYRRPKGL